MISVLKLELPIRLPSVANLREHWAAKARRVKVQRQTVAMALRPYGAPEPPVTVEITRIAARSLDSDNLASAAKGLRDGIADWLGVDDGHPGITWVYKQEHRKSEGMLMLFTAKGALKRAADLKVRIEVMT